MIERMKKQLFLIAVVGFLFAASTVSAQKVGGFLGYGAEIESLGIGVNGEFDLSQKLTLSPSFIFFFPNDDFTWIDLNGNLNYYFLNEGVDLYGLVGLNLAIVSYNGNNQVVEDNTDSELGLNFGFGANFDVGQKFEPFAEMKYAALSDFDQFSIIFGLKFRLK
jgi:outer membrane immunogenic protein